MPTVFAFLAAGIAVIVLPGPAVLYIVARSVHQGRRAGVLSALGVAVGGLVHVVAACLGVSALVLSSAVTFSIVKYAGAAYLLFLGVRTLTGRAAEHQLAAPLPVPLRKVFWQGTMVNVLNPKTALFFLAFLPQFVQVERGAPGLQTLMLGMAFVTLAFASDSAYALLSGSLRRRVHGFTGLRTQRYLAGGIYLALGVGAAAVNADPV